VVRAILIWRLALVPIALMAQDTRTVREPVFPPVCTRLAAQLKAGPTGLPAASETLFDTAAIQNAMNACPSGEAVELAANGIGNAFLIAPIKIPAGVTLIVDAGVTVFASRNPRDYDANSSQACGTIAASSSGCVPIITVSRADGSGIMGYGIIDGRGHLPMLVDGASSGVSWWDLARNAQAQSLNQNNPRMLQVSNTNNFTLYKITLMNSPFFHVSMGTDTNVTVWGIKIITPYDARNSDGVDPGYSSNVTIANSYLSDGDDNVAVGGNNNPGASNITVTHNFFGSGHGASIGSYTLAGVSNVLFDHITIAGDSADSSQAGIRIKSDVSRGGLVQNIAYRDFCMQNVRSPIVFDPFYTAGATGSLIPQYKNITLQNVHATTEGTVTIEGHDAQAATTITLNNVQLDGIKASDITQEYVSYTLGPDPVNFASMLTGAGVTVTDNVKTSNPPYPCPASMFSPIAGELIPGPPDAAPGDNLAVQVQVFPTKAVPYATYLANLKTDPNATLALPAPSGTVAIYDGAAVAGMAPVAGPLTTIPLGPLGVGVHTLTAAYSGDSNYAAITFGSYQVIVRAPRGRRGR